MLHPLALLTAEESRAADQATIAGGITGETLMENAGKAASAFIAQTYKPMPTLVVCGTGNNGGDGFVIARLLKSQGWSVTMAILGHAGAIQGDAKTAKTKWDNAGGTTQPFSLDLLKQHPLIIDAIFGTGLARPVEGPIQEAIEAINTSQSPVVAIDIASGINASTGEAMGAAIQAQHTVSFVRPKPGHVLLPGKAHTGTLNIYDIGISGDNVNPTHFLNAPPLWQAHFPYLSATSHKYTRGHSIVIGAPMHATGATRLAALAALRTGSGLVTVAATQEALPVYAISLLAVMVKAVNSLKELSACLADKRITAALIGPGCGVSETLREQTLLLLQNKTPCVIDADAITAFAASPASLFKAIQEPVVLTPHEGEFARLFNATGNKIERARTAAKTSGAVVVLKGNDTVIASPDGRIAINANAPLWLATAGSGDVLAGIITGLLAQGMPAFEAACAGVWLHSEAANHLGPGLIAEDLPAALPYGLKQLYS